MGKKEKEPASIREKDLEGCIELLKHEGRAFRHHSQMSQRLKQLEKETGDSRAKVYRCLLDMLKYGYSGSAEQKYKSGMLALRQAKQENEQYVMREAYRVLANLASSSGDWNLAIDYCWKVLEGAGELNSANVILYQEVYSDLALIFDRMGDIKSVAYYTRKALKCLNKFKKVHDSGRKLLAYYNLAYSYQCLMQNDLFEIYLDKCIKILDEHPEITRLRYAILVESCVLAIRKDRKEEAEARLKEVLKFDLHGQFWEILFNLFDVLLEKKEYDKCKRIMEYLKPLVNERNELLLEMSYLDNEIAYYRAVGDRKQYGESCRRYYELTMKEREENRKAILKSLDFTVKVNNKEVLLKGLKQEQISLTRKLEQDELTGLSSRYRVIECGNKMIEEAGKENKAVTVELMDVDYFKQYNDIYGHLEGDLCLKKIAEVIKNTLRKGDVGIRFGGDEFLIIRINCNKQEAKKLSEDIMTQVEKLAIPHSASQTASQVTVSQGVISGIPSVKQNLKDFLTLADQMLYKVKESGKNGYYLYEG